jgi:acyl-CoA thioester hydrolase
MSEPVPKVFLHEVRVPYAHVDQMGVVYYANYLVYFEMARSEMLREAGMPYGDLEAQGLRLPVVEARCEYKAPARFDDLLTIRTWCEGIKGPRVRLAYEVLRGEEVVATGHTIHACVSAEGKVIRPFPELRRLLPDEPVLS